MPTTTPTPRPAATPDLASVASAEVPARRKRRTYSASYKARILAEYEHLDAAGRGALLQREGLYSSFLSTWRALRDQGAPAALAAAPRPATRRFARTGERPAATRERASSEGARHCPPCH